jgi:hypothetical protein
LKKIALSQERAGGVAQGVGPEFRPQYYKKREGEIRGTPRK